VPLPQAIPLKEGVFEVGRASPADIQIPIPTVSSRHALLRVGEWPSLAAGAKGVGRADTVFGRCAVQGWECQLVCVTVAHLNKPRREAAEFIMPGHQLCNCLVTAVDVLSDLQSCVCVLLAAACPASPQRTTRCASPT
jgi:hypothetical protein